MDYVLSRAPHRVSLGSSADTLYFLNLIEWGNGLSFAISRYVYCLITINSGGVCVNSSIATGKFYNNISEITGKKSERPIGIIENAIRYFNEIFDLEERLKREGIKGLTITTTTDVPPESGLGGSASNTVAVILALSRLCGIKIERYDVAQMAYTIERSEKYMGITGGIQDQVAAVYGGINYMIFRKGDKNEIDFSVTPISEFSEFSIENLLLIRIPREKDGKDIHILQEEKSIIDPETTRRVLEEKRANVARMYNLCQNPSQIEMLGELFLKDNELKTRLGDVQTENTRRIFEIALENGALGGRIIGAGKGRSIIFYCEDKQRVLNSLRDFNVMKIDFDIDREGAKIIGEG